MSAQAVVVQKEKEKPHYINRKEAVATQAVVVKRKKTRASGKKARKERALVVKRRIAGARKWRPLLVTRRMPRRGAADLTSALIVFAVIAGFAIAFAVIFGVYNQIVADFNSTGIQIDSSFTNAVHTASSFAGTAIIIALAVGLITIVFYLIRAVSWGGAQ